MSIENEDKGRQQPLTKKWYNYKPTRFLRVVSFLCLYGVFIISDGYEFFERHHYFSVVIGFVATISLIYEAFSEDMLNSSYFTVLAALSIVAAGSLAYYAGPDLPQETETEGVLLPANDPDPVNDCDKFGEDLSHALVVLLGPSAGYRNSDKINALRIGNCNALSFERDIVGAYVNAEVFDPTGNIIVHVSHNGFNIVPGQYSYSKRPDRSTLIVYGKKGEEIFSVRFLNRHTIKARGIFACSGRLPVTVAENEISTALGVRITGGCGSYTKDTPESSILTIQ